MGFSHLNPSQELKKRALLEKEEIAKRRLEALSRATRKLQDLNENEAPQSELDLASKLKIDRLIAKRRSQLRTNLRPFLSRTSQQTKKS